MYALEVEDDQFSEDERALARSTLHALYVIRAKPTEATLSSIRVLVSSLQTRPGTEFSSHSLRVNARADAWLALCSIAKAISEKRDTALDPLISRAIDYVRRWFRLCGQREPVRSSAA